MKLSLAFSYPLILAVALPLFPVLSNADTLDFSVATPNRIARPGSVVTFGGDITNNVGSPLGATDLFLSFSGYDATNVTVSQLLGLTAFSIPDGSTSSFVDLFTFSLSAGTPPGTYAAGVILQAATGDISAPQTVSVTVPTPEPGSITLLLAGASILGFMLRRKRTKVLLPLLAVAVTAPSLVKAQVSAVQFVTDQPGIAALGSNLMVSLPIRNGGSLDATNVTVNSVTLQSGILASPTTFPVLLGTVAAGGRAIFQANFDATGLSQSTPYLMTVTGTYQVGGVTAGLSLNRFVIIPVASPGVGFSQTTAVGPNFVTGAPYPAQPINLAIDANETGPTVPTGPFVPGTPTPSGTASIPAALAATAQLRLAQPQQQPPAITFNANNGLGINSAGLSCSGVASASCAEPSGANSGSVIFVTTNWTAAYSTDGGTTFNQIDPTTVFPNDAVGYCCDQVVQYVPSIDRFIWLLQGTGYRLAMASPADIVNSGGTSWTYWNLTPSVFGTTGSAFDYPDLSVGNNSLYISWDAACSPSCSGGLQVARIALTGIQAGGTISIDYTNQSDSNVAWGSHLSQNTQDEIFWAGHNGNSDLRVFSWAEGSNTYYWRDVTVSSWSNATLTSLSPDGQDWMNKLSGFPANSVIGATRSANQLWFAWSAGTDGNFQQPHVEMVTLDRNNNFNVNQQVQIWNNGYAFVYPALATNACTGEVGLSLEYGGNGNYENHVVGFWGDYTVYTTTNSSVGTTRYGDYVTIRQDPTPNLYGAFFDAFGYGLNAIPAPGSGTQTDARYVVFGRGGACTPVIIR